MILFILKLTILRKKNDKLIKERKLQISKLGEDDIIRVCNRMGIQCKYCYIKDEVLITIFDTRVFASNWSKFLPGKKFGSFQFLGSTEEENTQPLINFLNENIASNTNYVFYDVHSSHLKTMLSMDSTQSLQYLEVGSVEGGCDIALLTQENCTKMRDVLNKKNGKYGNNEEMKKNVCKICSTNAHACFDLKHPNASIRFYSLFGKLLCMDIHSQYMPIVFHLRPADTTYSSICFFAEDNKTMIALAASNETTFEIIEYLVTKKQSKSNCLNELINKRGSLFLQNKTQMNNN